MTSATHTPPGTSAVHLSVGRGQGSLEEEAAKGAELLALLRLLRLLRLRG